MFQSTPSGGKATRVRLRVYNKTAVSIHAFRGEGDKCYNPIRKRLQGVSIHAFRGEGDVRSTSNTANPSRFQSTPSGGKATASDVDAVIRRRLFQSTPSGGKATRRSCCAQSSFDSFNPRLPGGRRRRKARRPGRSRQFQSTPSGGKATRWDSTRCSWHAPFQSTPSGGKATKNRFHAFARCAFQSTPSGGKATAATSAMTLPCSVSIHAFRGEGDW